MVVDFYADWCGPCKQIAPVMESLADRWDGRVIFGKVDIQAHPEIARGYNISSIPAVLRFEDGRVTKWCLGAKPAHRMEKELGLARHKEAPAGKGVLGRLFGGPR